MDVEVCLPVFCSDIQLADFHLVEYQQSNLVTKNRVKGLNEALNPDLGLLRAGRRLINVPVRRFSDDAPCDLHDGK